jgi:hypothetical protein
LLPFSSEPFVFPSAVKNVTIKIYINIILPVVLHGCRTWSLTLREEPILGAFENRVLRRISGPKRNKMLGGWRKQHNEEHRNLYSSPNIIRIINSRRIRWAGNVARKGRKMHIGFFGNVRRKETAWKT